MKAFTSKFALYFFVNSSIASDCVILLHGLARSDNSFSKMEQKLNEEGYFVINNSYPSTKHDIEALANDIIPRSVASCPDSSQVHFVTHSLGEFLSVNI